MLLAGTAAACTSNSGWSTSADDAAAASTRTLAPPDASAPLLFVARADTGSLEVAADGTAILELDEVEAMTWFTDRPARGAGMTSLTDALRTYGWDHNGDRLGDDAPNGALVAAELGTDAVILELLTASVDDARVRFAVEVVGDRTESTVLSHVELFIDDADPGSYTTMPSGLEVLDSGGVVLGRTVDSSGAAHTQVLHLAPNTPGVESSVAAQNDLVAVVSGANSSSAEGDMAVDDWRFTIDPTLSGDAAPIVVLKFDTTRSLTQLAADPRTFAAAADLMDDPAQTTADLLALLDLVVATSAAGDPLFASLAQTVQDPAWTGVLILRGSVSSLPATVQGQSTAPLAAPIMASAVGFTDGHAQSGAFFGTLDLASSGGSPSLQASFVNGALMSFAIGT